MTNSSPEQVLNDVLEGWKVGIEAHLPDTVAHHFTPTALFQGFRPEHTLGRKGVANYYASQPLGLTADYRILSGRLAGTDVIVGYVAVTFGFTDRPGIDVHLTVVLEQSADEWLISHYHVSKVD